MARDVLAVGRVDFGRVVVGYVERKAGCLCDARCLQTARCIACAEPVWIASVDVHEGVRLRREFADSVIEERQGVVTWIVCPAALSKRVGFQDDHHLAVSDPVCEAVDPGAVSCWARGTAGRVVSAIAVEDVVGYEYTQLRTTSIEGVDNRCRYVAAPISNPVPLRGVTDLLTSGARRTAGRDGVICEEGSAGERIAARPTAAHTAAARAAAARTAAAIRSAAPAALVAVVVVDHPRGAALACLGCPFVTRPLIPLGSGGLDVGASRTARAAGVARIAAPTAVVRAAAAGAVRVAAPTAVVRTAAAGAIRVAAPAPAVQAGRATRGASPAGTRVVILVRGVLSAASPSAAG